MDEIAGIILRISISYPYLLVIVRLSGKRTVAEGTPFDLVVALVVGDMPDDVIWNEVPVAQGIVGMGSVMLLHLLVVYASYRSPALRKLTESAPVIVLRSGKPLESALARERVPPREVEMLLREQEVEAFDEVAEAWIEPAGALGLRLEEDAKPLQRRDLQERSG